MTDYSELKRLAEAATIDDKPASTPIAELIGAQDAFLAECRPKKVLGLIAENEALRKDLKNLSTDNAKLIYAPKQDRKDYQAIGRTARRESVYQYVRVRLVAVSYKKNK